MFRPLVCSVAVLTLAFALQNGLEGRAQGQQPPGKDAGSGTKKESQEFRRRPAHVIAVLIETSRFDPEAREELQAIYDALRKLDKNNNGKIDDNELETARQELIEGRADYILKKLGKSKPGHISKAEAEGRIKEHFDQIDTNQDGYIDRNELIRAIGQPPKTEELKKAPGR